MHLNNHYMIRKPKILRFFLPYPVVLVSAAIILMGMVLVIHTKDVGVYGVLILFVAIAIITYREEIRLYENSCKFNKSVLFFNINKRDIKIEKIVALLLIKNIKGMSVVTYAPRSRGRGAVGSVLFELFVKTEFSELFIYRTSVEDKAEIIATSISEFYQITILRKTEKTFFPEKEFTGGVL